MHRRSLVDLRAPNPRIYFTDLALTSAVVYAGMAIAYWRSLPLGVLVAGLALSRAALFAHELSHQRNAVPGLRLAWHVLVGVPFLFPTFIYERVHREHHRRSVYRTERDPEHAPDPRSFLVRTLQNQAAARLLPFVLWIRWAIVTPLSFVIPGGRAFVLRRFSSLTMNAKYIGPTSLRRNERLAELACTAAAWAMLLMPGRALLAGALAMGLAIGISDFRGEFLHDFAPNAPTGTLERQVTDSVNLASKSPLVRLFFPMGIGLHALHHLAPWLPYHAMRTAYARLEPTDAFRPAAPRSELADVSTVSDTDRGVSGGVSAETGAVSS